MPPMPSKTGAKRASADLNSVIDPRFGDIEDDASSTQRRSLLSLAGSMLVEISFAKLVVAWGLLLILPGAPHRTCSHADLLLADCGHQ